MKKNLSFLFLILMTWGLSQTPGIIIRDGANNIPPLSRSPVLDPNQDGYVSKTTSGYTSSDTGSANEIPYIGISLTSNEPSGDIQGGPTGGFSDFVADSNGRSLYNYFDGTNLLFRLRIGNIVAGAKGYSVLIDADGLFGTADSTYTATNPGYEYEVSVQTGFKIAVYNVNNGTCTPVWETDLKTNPQYYQTAIALTKNDGNPDYFIDFYVPLSAFTLAGAVTSTTPLRYQIATVMAPQPALCGPVSDMYPPENISAQPACTPEQVANGTCPTQPCTSAPTVNPVTTGATAISGTWTKSTFSTQGSAVIEVFVNGVSAGTVIATSGTPWTLNTSAVADGAIIYATAVATNESQCNRSNLVKAQSCTPQNTSACPLTSCVTSRGAQATGVPGATIRLYKLEDNGDITLVHSGAVDVSGNWIYNPGGGGNTSKICETGSPNSIPNGTYYLVQQEPGKCPSACNTYFCVGLSSTATPTITPDPIYTRTDTISGTATAGATVRLMLNNILVATTTATAGGSYTFSNVTSYYAQVGDEFTVIAQSAGLCASSVTRTVSCEISSPTINNDGLGNVAAGSQLSGKSTEIGATIRIYNTANTLIGSTTVLADGTWLLSTPTVTAGVSYYALATNTCGTSGSSNTVVGTTPTSATRCGTITGPVLENATTVSGTITSAVANTTVTLYIDGSYIGSTITNTTAWSIPVNTDIRYTIYGGGVLSIGIKESGKTEVLCPNPVTVTCAGPAVPVMSNSSYSGSQSSPLNVTVTNSEFNVLYTLKKSDGTDYGVSQFGNGGSLTLTTYPLDFVGSQNFYVSAVSLRSTICSSSSALFTINSLSSVCYKPAQTAGSSQVSVMGITALGRAGTQSGNWPMVRNGAWTVLEAKTKGFVINRLTNAQVAAIPSADLREGMMIYNITLDCLQINTDGTATGWSCFISQACPD